MRPQDVKISNTIAVIPPMQANPTIEPAADDGVDDPATAIEGGHVLVDDPDLYDAKATATRNRDGTVSRSRRGGAWTDDGLFLRTAFRARFEPERRYDHIGFRVAVVRP